MKYSTIRDLLQHPLGSRAKCKSLLRFMTLGLKKRLTKSTSFIYSFIGDIKSVVRKGISTSELQYYSGLSEFYEMGFLLHFLRQEDTFVDVGANIGSYTLLASGYVGAKTIAFEPVPITFSYLQENCDLNKLGSKIELHNMGVSEKEGSLSFTVQHDAINHVIRTSNENSVGVTIKTDSLDNILSNENPTLIKIDVEGYETKVIEGAQTILVKDSVCAIIIELNGLANKYGFDESKIHETLLSKGFLPYSYKPFTRELTKLEIYGSKNTLYLKNIEFVKERLKSAPKITLFGLRF